MHVHAHTHMHTRVCTHKHRHTHIRTCTHTCVHTHIHTHTTPSITYLLGLHESVYVPHVVFSPQADLSPSYSCLEAVLSAGTWCLVAAQCLPQLCSHPACPACFASAAEEFPQTDPLSWVWRRVPSFQKVWTGVMRQIIKCTEWLVKQQKENTEEQQEQKSMKKNNHHSTGSFSKVTNNKSVRNTSKNKDHKMFAS